MDDGDDRYSRLMEKTVADLRVDVDKHAARIGKLELWRNTVLGFVAGLIFLAGTAARDLIALFKSLGG